MAAVNGRDMEPTSVGLGRHELVDLDRSLAAEWLVTNGLGGYASGTVAGANTRRYHGLLVAGFAPPVRRRVLVAKVDEEIEIDDGDGGERSALSTNEYHDGTIDPHGYLRIEQFELDGTLPVWRWRVRDVELEKSIAMVYGRNTTVVRYRLLSAPGPLRLRLTPFSTDRDFHEHTHGALDWRFGVGEQPGGCVVRAWDDATSVGLFGWVDGDERRPARFVETGLWYWHFLHRAERARGLDDLEDLFTPGLLVFDLRPGETAWFVGTAERDDFDSSETMDCSALFETERERQRRLIRATPGRPSPTRARLALAADQFVIARGGGETVIAGYHWFADWGRDTAIALDGLCGATGRHDEARAVLRTFARYVDAGMVPNRFPEDGESAEYNSADAALWYVEALARHLGRTGDEPLLRELLSTIDDILNAHHVGTRHGIGVDPIDGLLRAGAPGLQLTWMDARVGDWVVTPRAGKPVELSALWYSALRHAAGWHARMGHLERTAELEQWATAAREGFNRRFWNDSRGCCFDVVESHELGGVDDGRLRPNQIAAIGLPHPILALERWAPLLETVERELLTPAGLRTLAPGDDGYRGRYGGGVAERDGGYHQGPVWPWLTGLYVDAARRVRGADWDSSRVTSGILERFGDAGLGTISELYEGDPPYRADGAVGLAWSVAELLRVLTDSDVSVPLEPTIGLEREARRKQLGRNRL